MMGSFCPIILRMVTRIGLLRGERISSILLGSDAVLFRGMPRRHVLVFL